MVFLYDGSYEGFLSAVFDAYAVRTADGALIRPVSDDMTFPLEDWRDVCCSAEKAERVTRKLRALDIAETVYDAWLSRDADIENNLLGVIALAIREGRSPMDRQYIDRVRAVTGAARRVRTEAHRFLQFVRFVKVENRRPALTDGKEPPGLYVADIEPEYDILPRLAGAFRISALLSAIRCGTRRSYTTRRAVGSSRSPKSWRRRFRATRSLNGCGAGILTPWPFPGGKI